MKPRLGVCQLYFHLDPQNLANEFDSLQIVIEKDKLNINSCGISLPCEVIPQSLNGLSRHQNGLTFRIHLNECTVKPNHTLILPCNYREPISELETNKTLMLQCTRCNCNILKNEIVLGHITSELTDLIDVSDIFCHREKNVLKFEKYFSRNDSTQWIHFEAGSFKIMHVEEENLDIILEDVVRCRYCLGWLGLRSKEQGYLQFWCDTVKFGHLLPTVSQNLISKCIFYELIRNTLSDCFFTPCHFSMVCKISPKQETCISLCVLDKTDSVREYDCETAKCSKFLKIVFEENDRSKNNFESGIHQTIFISKPTLCDALRTLYASCDISENTSKVAYLSV